MRPIEIETYAAIQKSSEEICSILIDTDRWTEFTGYSIIPGIKSAHFEIKTPAITGSRIKVENSDGSSHIEEIIEWEIDSKATFKFHEFNSPLKKFATHFIETWDFNKSSNGTDIKRMITIYPKSILGRIILFPISCMLKKAIEKNLKQLSQE